MCCARSLRRQPRVGRRAPSPLLGAVSWPRCAAVRNLESASRPLRLAEVRGWSEALRPGTKKAVGGWEAEVCGEQNRGACLGISGGSRVWQTHLRERCLPHGRKAPAALSETERYLSSQFPSHVR